MLGTGLIAGAAGGISMALLLASIDRRRAIHTTARHTPRNAVPLTKRVPGDIPWGLKRQDVYAQTELCSACGAPACHKHTL